MTPHTYKTPCGWDGSEYRPYRHRTDAQLREGIALLKKNMDQNRAEATEFYEPMIDALQQELDRRV